MPTRMRPTGPYSDSQMGGASWEITASVPKLPSGSFASAEQVDRRLREAHHQCFLANALRVELEISPRPAGLSPGVKNP